MLTRYQLARINKAESDWMQRARLHVAMRHQRKRIIEWRIDFYTGEWFAVTERATTVPEVRR